MRSNPAYYGLHDAVARYCPTAGLTAIISKTQAGVCVKGDATMEGAQ